MPESVEFQNLRDLADELTQSVSHHAYFSQKFADKFNLPTLLLPPYIDLSRFEKLTLEEKDNLIIYSRDNAQHKSKVLQKIQSELPEYELVEIKDITFDEFMELATRCKFSISFAAFDKLSCCALIFSVISSPDLSKETNIEFTRPCFFVASFISVKSKSFVLLIFPIICSALPNSITTFSVNVSKIFIILLDLQRKEVGESLEVLSWRKY